MIESVYFVLQTAPTYRLSSKLKQTILKDSLTKKKLLSTIKVHKGNCLLSMERNRKVLDHGKMKQP